VRSLFVLAVLLAGCASANPAREAIDAQASPPTPNPSESPMYFCPMHPEVTSDQPGKCPKCGMDLVKRSQ
jgi:hypothetical protein